MAKEYIEREAATRIIKEYGKIAIDVGEPFLDPINDIVTISKYIANMPAADVAPVVHGRWLYVDTDTEQFFLCNRCKKKEYWESNYCPNCGARMDGDKR